MTRMSTVKKWKRYGLVHYDEDQGKLIVARPWGLLCLNANPFHATGIDLQHGCEWIDLPNLRLDLRGPLQQIRELKQRRRWDETLSDYTAVVPLVVDPESAIAALAWRDFFQDVGGIELCLRAARFHPSVQYSALRYLTINTRLAALADHNPGLFLGVLLQADSWTCNPPTRRIRLQALLQGKQRDLATRLGFSADACRVLSRMDPHCLTARRWNRFRRAWNRSRRVRSIARHLPRLPQLVLDLLSLPQSLNVLDSRVFHEMARSPWETQGVGSSRFIRWLTRVLDAKKGSSLPDCYRVRTWKQFKNTICHVTSFLPVPASPLDEVTSFPPPPVPGETDYIEPIRDMVDLCREAVFMKNCCLSYASMVTARKAYFFRTLPLFGMQRSTVLLCPTMENGRRIWEVAEARTRHNIPCTDLTLRALQCFFEQQQFIFRRDVPLSCESSSDLD